ncbi:MAG TPA: TylF/MycF/NovP-related O-methyltransferase [Terriglobales bacterium]|nr:TylF/MycF/NovP-related O-methyltransferase [Terriglobales bacterium]
MSCLSLRVPQSNDASRLYLDLMKGCLTRSIFGERYRELRRPVVVGKRARPVWMIHTFVAALLRRWNLEIVERVAFDDADCEEGGRWPAEAETMVGTRRLDNIEYCIRDILDNGVPGDLIETGVWRGGASIYMLAVLHALGDASRHVWMADSFAGLPKPDARNAADVGDIHWMLNHVLAIPLAEVKANVEKYGLLHDRVHFLKGWFNETLPNAPIDRIALLRLDGDMYGSTMDALQNLYPKLASGGFCIIDDYALTGCRQAVDEFRSRNHITEELIRIDHSAVFWKRC